MRHKGRQKEKKKEKKSEKSVTQEPESQYYQKEKTVKTSFFSSLTYPLILTFSIIQQFTLTARISSSPFHVLTAHHWPISKPTTSFFPSQAALCTSMIGGCWERLKVYCSWIYKSFNVNVNVD